MIGDGSDASSAGGRGVGRVKRSTILGAPCCVGAGACVAIGA